MIAKYGVNSLEEAYEALVALAESQGLIVFDGKVRASHRRMRLGSLAVWGICKLRALSQAFSDGALVATYVWGHIIIPACDCKKDPLVMRYEMLRHELAHAMRAKHVEGWPRKQITAPWFRGDEEYIGYMESVLAESAAFNLRRWERFLAECADPNAVQTIGSREEVSRFTWRSDTFEQMTSNAVGNMTGPRYRENWDEAMVERFEREVQEVRQAIHTARTWSGSLKTYDAQFVRDAEQMMNYGPFEPGFEHAWSADTCLALLLERSLREGDNTPEQTRAIERALGAMCARLVDIDEERARQRALLSHARSVAAA